MNLIGKLADNAIKSLQDPKGTAGKIVVQAKGTAALGRRVAEQVGRSAVSMAAETATSVVGKASGRKPAPKLAADAPRAETPPPTSLRSVPNAKSAAATPTNNPLSKDQVTASPAKVAAVVEAAVATDPATTAATKAPAQKSTPSGRLPTKKSATKKSG